MYPASAILTYPRHSDIPMFLGPVEKNPHANQGKPKTRFPSIWALDGELKMWGFAFRIVIVVVTIIFAVVIPHFTILMGFIGNMTGICLSFIWPSFFHLKLRRHVISWYTMCYDMFIIFLGLMFGIVGMYYSGRAMKRAFELGVPV